MYESAHEIRGNNKVNIVSYR